jgi:hypothetical protein
MAQRTAWRLDAPSRGRGIVPGWGARGRAKLRPCRDAREARPLRYPCLRLGAIERLLPRRTRSGTDRPRRWHVGLSIRDRAAQRARPGARPDPVARIPVAPGNGDLCFEWPGRPRASAHLREHAIGIEQGPVPRNGARGLGMSVYFRDPNEAFSSSSPSRRGCAAGSCRQRLAGLSRFGG